MAQIKEEIELKIAELQMDYYMTDNNFASANEYVKAELQKGVELSNGAEVSCDESGKLSYEGLEIGTFNSDGTVTIDGELSGNQIVTKYTVSYNANGGQGVPASKKYAAGESVSVDFTTKPTKKGANFLGWAISSTATTPEYTNSGSFTMGSQSVTLYAVWETLAGTAAIKAEYYGDNVNYSANGVSDWKVFLNDGSNVYLIASDYVHNSGMTVTSDVAKVEGNDYCVKGNSRDGLVNWLTNESNWSAYASGLSGATATGGPTKPQFVQSYNAKYGTSHSSDLGNDSSFTVSEQVAPYIIINTSNASAYWLSSTFSADTGGVWRVSNNGNVYNINFSNTSYGIRPLVKLPANAKMNWNGTVWDLSE